MTLTEMQAKLKTSWAEEGALQKRLDALKDINSVLSAEILDGMKRRDKDEAAAYQAAYLAAQNRLRLQD